MIEVPAGLRWLAEEPGGEAWLAELPASVEACVQRWSLRLEEPFEVETSAFVTRVSRADGSNAVLKMSFPHRETLHEADALRAWDGDGVVRLFASDEARHALLIERCVPGEPLSTIDPDDALTTVIELLRRAWRAGGEGFPTLEDEAAWWADSLPRFWLSNGRPFERALLDEAMDALRNLPPSQRDVVLVNQDLHAGNVLNAEREPWLTIDPEPLLGEREFGVVPIVRGAELGPGEAALARRFDRVCAELSLDRERVRGWGIAQTLAWAIDATDVIPHQVEIARWFRRLVV